MTPSKPAVALALAAALATPLAAAAQTCPDPMALAGEAGEAGEGGEATPAERDAAWAATVERLLADAAAAAELAPRDPGRARDILESASDDAMGRLMRAAGPGLEPRGAELVGALPTDPAAQAGLEAMLPAAGRLARAGALLASAGVDYLTATQCGPAPGRVGDAMAAAAARGALLRAHGLAQPVLTAPGGAAIGASLRALLAALPVSLQEGEPAPIPAQALLVMVAQAQLLLSDFPP